MPLLKTSVSVAELCAEVSKMKVEDYQNPRYRFIVNPETGRSQTGPGIIPADHQIPSVEDIMNLSKNELENRCPEQPMVMTEEEKELAEISWNSP